MGLQQSTDSVRTFDAAVVDEHIRKMESLRGQVSAVWKENDFLRRRINDLTEYSSILEDELKKEKIKSSEKDENIDRYMDFCRKLEMDNESLVEQNNKLVFESFNLNDQKNNFAGLGNLGQSFGQSQREENYNETTRTTISPLLRLHKQLENLRFEVDSTKNNLLKEINAQKSSVNDSELNELIREHDRCNQKLVEQGVFVGEKNLQQVEQTYRYVCLKNNERKIEVMKRICKIENDLNAFSEQLGTNTSELIERIRPRLGEHETMFRSNLKGTSFAEDYQNERRIYEDLMAKLSNEVTYFRKLMPSGPSNDVSNFTSNVNNYNAQFFDKSDSKNAFKGWSFDVFDGKKS